MGVAERRERERELLRARIIDAARDLLLESGVDAISMRAIAERIEYSPATIYIYFQGKEELIRAVVTTGFERLRSLTMAERARVGETAGAAVQYGALGRAYARFAVDNPAYFRIMFELPSTAELQCQMAPVDPEGFEEAVVMVEQAVAAGELEAPDPRRVALLGWATVHGLTTLYLSGHLQEETPTTESFYDMVEFAMTSLFQGWRPGKPGGEDE